MKLTTITIPAVEMTQKEEDNLWFTSREQRIVEGKKVKIWSTNDGRNELLLEGELYFRVIVKK